MSLSRVFITPVLPWGGRGYFHVAPKPKRRWPKPFRCTMTSFTVILMKKGGITLPGARKDQWLPWKNSKSPFWKSYYLYGLETKDLRWNLLCMLEISQKLGEIPIFGTFLAKFSILTYVLQEIGYFGLGHVYDIIVTSYVECLYLFWYV